MCGTALVELDCALGKLGLFIEGVPSKIKCIVTEITNKFSSCDVLHDEEFEETNEGNNLCNAGSGDGINCTETVRDGSKGGARVVNVTWETDSVFGDKVSDHGKHGNTSVLDLNISETIEFVLVTVRNQAKRIEESKRCLGSKLTLKSNGLDNWLGTLLERGSLLWRSQSRGRCDEGSNDNRFHFKK